MAHLLMRGVGRLSQEAFVSGRGVWVVAQDGKKYLDMTSGIGVVNVGHSHPVVIEAAKKQCDAIVHAQANTTMSDKYLELLEVLETTLLESSATAVATASQSALPTSALLHSGQGVKQQQQPQQDGLAWQSPLFAQTLAKAGQAMKQHHQQHHLHIGSYQEKQEPVAPYDSFMLVSTGAEAIENAVKIARAYTQRPDVIVFQGGFHGRTVATMSMTTSSVIYRQHMGASMGGVHVAPFPYELHGVDTDAALAGLHLMLKQQVHPSDVACIVIEPVLGEGGYVPCPPAFMKGVRSVCDAHGILLVMDEVQTGFGRTGHLFASEGHCGVRGDILTMAKGLASGFPLAAVASHKYITDALSPGMLGGTYAGNAVACAAAIATQRVIKDEALVENSQWMGKRLMNGLQAAVGDRPYVRDIRGVGCMVGVEFTADCPAGTKAKVTSACHEQGMVMLGTSTFETIRFIPPLVINADQVDMAVSKFERALDCAMG